MVFCWSCLVIVWFLYTKKKSEEGCRVRGSDNDEENGRVRESGYKKNDEDGGNEGGEESGRRNSSSQNGFQQETQQDGRQRGGSTMVTSFMDLCVHVNTNTPCILNFRL